jgi:hypothetical protein
MIDGCSAREISTVVDEGVGDLGGHLGRVAVVDFHGLRHVGVHGAGGLDAWRTPGPGVEAAVLGVRCVGPGRGSGAGSWLAVAGTAHFGDE